MGGKLCVAVRYKDRGCVAFKIHTSFLKKINTPQILDENWLKKTISDHALLAEEGYKDEDTNNALHGRDSSMAEDYSSKKAVFAPYYYGMILIDYHRNTIISANNYDTILRANSFDMYTQYLTALQANFILTYENDNKTIEYDLREAVFYDFYLPYFLTHAIEHQAIITYKGKKIVHDGTMPSIVGSIYGLPLAGLSREEQIKILQDYKLSQDLKDMKNWNGKIDFDKFNDITFDYPDFCIINAGNALDSKVIHDYMLQHDFNLSDYENHLWHKYIEEQKSM